MAPRKKLNKKQIAAAEAIASESLKKEEISKSEQVLIDQLVAQTLARYKVEDADKKIKIKEISHLSLMAEEYLSSFALIGYSIENEKVVILNMPTAKDEAALVDLLRATFLDIAGNRP